MSALWALPATALLAGYAAGDFSPVDVVDALAERIAAVDGDVNAYTALALDAARKEAQRAERDWREGTIRALSGVPLAVKDLFDTAGLATTYGSAMFAGHVPEADAGAVRRARRAGAIVLGKTLTHEFAWGITCDNPHQGPCRNPWDLGRVAGGSSGGSAAALAYGGAPLALGTDTGGSIRIPAAFCGVVGFKPTRGRVSLAGAFPLAPSLDHAGPLARTAGDARLLYDAIRGVDEADPGTAIQRDAGPPLAPGKLRVGISADLAPVALAPAVERALAAARAALEALGARVREVRVAGARDAYAAAFAPVQLAEARRVHERAGLFPARAGEYGPDVRARLERAGDIGLGDYLAALEAGRRLTAGLAAAFADVHVLLGPVAAAGPVRVGEDAIGGVRFRDLVMPCTVPQDVAGVPACALPAGRDDDGVPVGIQLTAPWWHERRVLAAAEALSEALPGPGIARS